MRKHAVKTKQKPKRNVTAQSIMI